MTGLYSTDHPGWLCISKQWQDRRAAEINIVKSLAVVLVHGDERVRFCSRSAAARAINGTPGNLHTALKYGTKIKGYTVELA